MKLQFKLLNREKIVEGEDFFPYHTVNYLKEYITENFNIPEPELFYKGFLLMDNDNTLNNYSIKENDTFYVVRKNNEKEKKVNSTTSLQTSSINNLTNVLQTMLDLNYSYNTPPPGINQNTAENNDFFPNETHIPQLTEVNEVSEVSDNSELYQEQLDTLENMGFTDNTRNIQILNLTNGNLQEALSYLL